MRNGKLWNEGRERRLRTEGIIAAQAHAHWLFSSHKEARLVDQESLIT